MLAAIPFPEFDPVIFAIGPVALRWYALAYIAGLVLGILYLKRLVSGPPVVATRDDADDFLVWATLGVILGGRLGYILFYQPAFFAQNPGEVFALWRGGMSFHGGFLGVVVAGILFTRRRGISPLAFGDLVACVSPIGLFFGRIANFINGELFGRTTDVAWGVVFPRGGPEPRHPSQLYEAVLEGLVLFAVVNLLRRNESLRRRPGLIMGVFIAGYAAARSIVEVFRQPDAHIGFLTLGSTMGQWLSLPMFLVGLFFILRARPQD